MTASKEGQNVTRKKEIFIMVLKGQEDHRRYKVQVVFYYTQFLDILLVILLSFFYYRYRYI